MVIQKNHKSTWKKEKGTSNEVSFSVVKFKKKLYLLSGMQIRRRMHKYSGYTVIDKHVLKLSSVLLYIYCMVRGRLQRNRPCNKVDKATVDLP